MKSGVKAAACYCIDGTSLCSLEAIVQHRNTRGQKGGQNLMKLSNVYILNNMNNMEQRARRNANLSSGCKMAHCDKLQASFKHNVVHISQRDRSSVGSTKTRMLDGVSCSLFDSTVSLIKLDVPRGHSFLTSSMMWLSEPITGLKSEYCF